MCFRQRVFPQSILTDQELRTWGGPEWPRPCFSGFPLGRKPGCWLTRVSPSCVLGTEARPGWGKAHWKVTIGTMHTCTWRSRKRRESNIRQSGTFAMPQKMVVAAWLINGNARVHTLKPLLIQMQTISTLNLYFSRWQWSSYIRFCKVEYFWPHNYDLGDKSPAKDCVPACYMFVGL